MCLITRVTSSMFLKRFPRRGFFNSGNKSKADGLILGLYGGWGSTCHPYFSKISYTAPEAWGRALMYGRWSLREIWLQSVSSSISRHRFAEQGPRSLPIRKHCSLLKFGSQMSRKSERLHHPTGRASAACRTFEMTHVYLSQNSEIHIVTKGLIFIPGKNVHSWGSGQIWRRIWRCNWGMTHAPNRHNYRVA